MPRSTLLFGITALALCGGGVVWWLFGRSDGADVWRTAAVERADVRRLVTATGTLGAVTTVEVGTQVSGILSEIAVDFNDRVVIGQVLARIDTALLDADVASALARVAEAEAGRGRSELESRRVLGLQARGAATGQEAEVATAELAITEAQLRVAQVALTRARRNLGYATITSPIDGTVIRRDLDPGQTVNAGLSAPTLFLIAGDLADMQILVAVDESDIGQIRAGQQAEFSVQTWPDRVFKGVVRQVRLQSATSESVVTYTAVVSVDNDEGVLLPGMTATVEFIVDQADDVLCVANAALRFTPDESSNSRAARHTKSGSEGTLWTAVEEVATAVPVTVGLRGTNCTQVSGEGLADGLAVIVGVDRAGSGGTTNPLQQTAPPRRPGGF